MENANPFIPAPPVKIRARITQELNELRAISAMIDSHLENIGHTHIPIPPHVSFEQLLDDFMNPPDVFKMDDSESDNFVVLEDIGEFIVSDMADVLIGRPFRTVSQLEYDCVKELISFTRIFDTYTFRIPRTIPMLTNFDWSKVQPILELSQRDLMGGLSAWMTFGGNTRDMTQFGKKRDKITTLHEEAQKILHTDCGDGVRISSDAVRICKQRRHDSCDSVRA
nr:hypothetical protein [Tanacetum cinerariifolium]